MSTWAIIYHQRSETIYSRIVNGIEVRVIDTPGLATDVNEVKIIAGLRDESEEKADMHALLY